MGYELKQELRLTQTLVMTPQLQLAIKLLQLSRLELVEMVRQEVETNPVIDETGEAATDAGMEEAEAAPVEEPVKPEVDWEAFLEDQARSSSQSSGGIDFNAQEEDDDLLSTLSSTEAGLGEHLRAQLNLCGLGEDDMPAAEFIIGNIDDDGYLRLADSTGASPASDDETEAAALRAICVQTGAAPDQAGRILRAIQRLDPLGAGSRTLRECLLIQAAEMPVRDTVVEDIIRDWLGALANKNYKAIARALGVTVEDVYEAAGVINHSLNPSPGRGFGSVDARSIIPDVYINKIGGDYVITLNEDGLPKLRISPYYRQVLKGSGAVNGETRDYIQGKLRSAVWLIKSVHQRQRTIYRVVECIVRFQREFLDRGLKHLRPLVLRDVAAEIGVHESTVSRVTSNKYVQTPRGLFELKYFFSNSVGKEDNGDLTAEYIKERVAGIIKAEDPKKPLSDMEIVERLKGSGIRLARRTAAKYREELGIQSSTRRRAVY
ncbi:MAG: RNA polymerase factor sigma-54 [Deltaproteobacteria bacterium]|nr:RNA polymerase factor sigma-54 [Deltaproteobacteria bacterium]